MAELTESFYYDSYELRNWDIHSNGYLWVISPVASVGTYPYIDSVTGELYEETVERDVLIDSIETFKMLPVTSPSHPPVKLNTKNTKDYQRGSLTHAAYVDDRFLWFGSVITDHEAIEKVKSGEAKEYSLGYDAKTGTKQGKIHQLKRIGNHGSLVPKGRHGKDVSIKLDSVDNLLVMQEIITADKIGAPPNELYEKFRDDKKPIITVMSVRKTEDKKDDASVNKRDTRSLILQKLI